MSRLFLPPLRVRLFGPPRIERDGQITYLTALREVAVLALLGVGRAEQARAELLALLWPDSPPAAARKNLRNTLWGLRRVLGEDAVRTRGEHVVLAEDLWVDVRDFGAAARLLRLDTPAGTSGGLPDTNRPDTNGPDTDGEEAAHQFFDQTLEAMLGLSTGTFLEGVAAPEDSELDVWLRTQRDHLCHLQLEALTRGARRAAVRGAWAQVPPLVGRALAQDPLLEPLHGLLMEAHVHLGQRGEALRQFARLRETLTRELGLDPSPEILTLHARIVAGELGSGKPSVSEVTAPVVETVQADHAALELPGLINLLPLDSSQRFFGRERERAELGRLLAERPRLLGVYGRGGVGKTALLCRALLDLAASGPFPYAGTVSLGPTTTGVDWTRIVEDFARLLPEAGRAALLRDAHQPGRTPRQNAHTLLGHLRGGHYLLVLDQAERLINPLSGEVIDRDLRALLLTVLRQGGPLTVAHTTRAPGAIPAAWMSWERSVHLTDGLTAPEAAALLRACDPDGRAGLRKSSDEQLAPIARATAGLPRALEAVAGLLLERPLLSLAELCEAPGRFLGEANGWVVGQVLGQLPPELLRVLEVLALFGGPVPRAALAHVLRPFLAEETLGGLLQRLIRSHLVQHDPAAGTFALHAIDRDYAYQRIPTHGDETSAAGVLYCRRTLHRLAAAYHRSVTPVPTTPGDAEGRLHEFEHLLAAQEGDQAAEVLLTLGPPLTQWGQLSRLARLHSALCGHVADSTLARGHLIAQGRALGALGRAADAAAPLQEAQALAQAAGDAQGELDALLELAALARSRLSEPGGQREWQAVTEQALAVARNVQDQAGRAAALRGIGDLCLSAGVLGQARGAYREALLEVCHKADRTQEGALLYRLGLVHAEFWELEAARSLLTEALHLNGEHPGPAAEAATLGALGTVLAGQGDLRAAADHTRRALALQRQGGDRPGECWNLGNLGIWALLEGEPQRAVVHLRDAVNLARDIGAQTLVSFKGVFLTAALLLAGESGEALRVAGEVRAIDTPTNNDGAALLHGVALAHAGRTSEVCEAFEAARLHAEARLRLNPGLPSAIAKRGLAEAGLAIVTAQPPERAARSLQAVSAVSAPGMLLYGQQLLGLLTHLPGAPCPAPLRHRLWLAVGVG